MNAGNGASADLLQALAAQVAVFQAALLAATALHKACRWRHALEVLRNFAGVPRAWSAPSCGAVIAAELLAGAALAIPSYRAAGASLAALLWTLYLVLIARAVLADRRDLDCGCSFGPASRPLGAFQVSRNAVLAGLAVSAAWLSVGGRAVAAEGSQLLGGLALLALYGALDQVMALRPPRAGAPL